MTRSGRVLDSGPLLVFDPPGAASLHLPTKGPSMRSWLVRLLILALAPVCVLASSVPAEAATYGATDAINFTWQEGTSFIPPSKCDLTVFYRQIGVDTAVGIKGGDCDESWGSQIDGGVQFNTPGSGVKITAKGLGDSGQACSLSSSTMPFTAAGGFGPDYAIWTGGGCNVSQICWEFTAHKNIWVGGDDHAYATSSGCKGTDLGQHPTNNPNAPTCSMGLKITGVKINTFQGTGADSGITFFSARVFYKGTKNYPSTSWRVMVRPYITYTAQSPVVKGFHHQNSADDSSPNVGEYFGSPTTPAPSGGHVGPGYYILAAYPTATVQGAMVYIANQDVAQGANQEPAGQVPGYTTPGACNWYFGDKVVNDPLSAEDEPAGPLLSPDDPAPTGEDPNSTEPAAPEPPDDTSGCTFKVSDPSTWASGALCAVVGLLGQIWDTLKGLVSAIGDLPGLIASAIGNLFIPDDAPSFTDIDSPIPDGWLPSLPSLGAAPCGALTMPELSLGYRDWSVGPVSMLNTCDDPWPLVRKFTYNGLLALLLIGVVWAGFHAVTGGLGMSVSSGSGGDDDH